MNILEQARGIIYDKSEEKERQYGDFFENMEDAAKIASVMSKKEFTAEDIYHALIGLKFARESFTHKHDNILDAIAYLASLHEYKEAKISKIKDYEVIDPVVVKPRKKDSKTLDYERWFGNNTGTVDMSFAHISEV